MPFIVHIDQLQFMPPVAHVRKGEAVRWKWDSVAPHDVTSRGKRRFKSSGTRKRGAKYRVVFRKVGTYRYYCTIHPSMTGRVVVTNPPKD